MTSPDFSTATWRKSTRSGSSNGGGGTNCVEVAFSHTHVGVRDSKNLGPKVPFTRAAWQHWLQHL